MREVGPVGLGLVGAGHAITFYRDELRAFPDVDARFVAVIDSADSHREGLDHSGADTGSVDDLLNHPDVEIVINLADSAARAEITRQALTAGKHVWTHSPIAPDRAIGKALLDDAQSRGLCLSAVPDALLGQAFQTGLRLLEQGQIGMPLTALAMCQMPGPEVWNENPEVLYSFGGGPLFHRGSSYITALVQALGPVARVAATSSMSHEKRTIMIGPRAGEEFFVEAPSHVSALIEFESGASAQCVFSFQSELTRTGVLEISGSAGTLVFPDPNGFSGDLEVWRSGRKEPQEVFTRPGPGRGAGIVDLARALRSGLSQKTSGELGYHVLDVLWSITEAAEGGQFVEVASALASAPSRSSDWDSRKKTL